MQTCCTCRGCGVVFWRKLGKRNKGLYHSRQCAFAHHAAGGNRRKPKPKQLKPPTPLRTCAVCGTEHVTRSQTCSPECKVELSRRKSKAYYLKSRTAKTERACLECGKFFTPEYGSKRRTFCKLQCQRRATRRIAKAIRKARKRKVIAERFDPLEILRRDKHRCQLCGVATPARLRGKMVPNAPEVDHIIPLALGGCHSYENTQCLCRKCNHNKRNTTRGQLRLAM